MKRVLLALTATAMLLLAPAHAAVFDIEGYQDEQGAITVHREGDFADPYFALKALLLAHQSGLDIRNPAERFIAWLLPRQDPAGVFHRYCKQDGAWLACKGADADDALLALWMELLYVMAPDSGLPSQWKQSAGLSGKYLNTLRNPKLGIYQISLANPAGLFMDNVEIYAALRGIGQAQKRMGAHDAARDSIRRAVRLRGHIERVFHPRRNMPYLVSTQESGQQRFYPEAAAQVYPWLHRMPIAGSHPGKDFDVWMAQHGETWLDFANDDYPWGLIAVAGLEAGDCRVAVRWAEQAFFLRHGPRWNVLEEAAMQIIHHASTADVAPCRKEVAAR